MFVCICVCVYTPAEHVLLGDAHVVELHPAIVDAVEAHLGANVADVHACVCVCACGCVCAWSWLACLRTRAISAAVYT